MLGPTYQAFKRLFCCACLTRPLDFLSRSRNLAGATHRIKIDKTESQVAHVGEAEMMSNWNHLKEEKEKPVKKTLPVGQVGDLQASSKLGSFQVIHGL